MNSPIAHAFSQAGPVGQFILVSLFVFSIGVWGIIARKIQEAHERKKNTAAFLTLFHRNATDIFSLRTHLNTPCPLAELFKSGINHLAQLLKGKNQYPEESLSSIEGGETAVAQMTYKRTMIGEKEITLLGETLERAITTQLMKLDRFHVLLAITAGAAPLLGLLGTVWGIMESFRSMGLHGNASISVVAPGISTALVTTVAGLIVAIPALIAYNLLVNQLKRAATEMENFAAEFLSHVKQRYLNN